MIGDRIDRLTQERQEMENPCCDCKESGMSTTCRCDDKIKWDVMNYPCFKCTMSDAGKAACCGCPERLEYEKHKHKKKQKYNG